MARSPVTCTSASGAAADDGVVPTRRAPGTGRGTCTGSGCRPAARGRRRAGRRGTPSRTAARGRPGTPRRRGCPPSRARRPPRSARCVVFEVTPAIARSTASVSTTATVLSAGGGEGARHRVEPVDGVGPGLLDPLVGVVVVDGVGDEQDRAVGVVEDGEVGGEHQGDLGQAEHVGRGARDLLPAAHGVVGDGADHAAGERREARRRARSRARPSWRAGRRWRARSWGPRRAARRSSGPRRPSR